MPIEIPFSVTAFFYSMVGHGGASGYQALGALMGLPLAGLRTSSLMLNLGVAGVAAVCFARAGWLRWQLLGSLCLASVPAAFVMAQVKTGASMASALLALALAFSALRLFFSERLRAHNEARPRSPAQWPALAALGLALGVLSGLTGVGGGIYLSPLLLLLRWAGMKETAAVSAAFIVVNSLAGLAGLASQGPLPALPASWLVATLVGGATGAWLGAGWVPQRRLAQVLAGVLMLAALKLGWRALG